MKAEERATDPMTETDGHASTGAPRASAPAGRLERVSGVAEAIRLSYFAWVPTVASIAIGIGFLVYGQPVLFVLSTLVGMLAGLGWAIWFNVDR